MNARLEEYYCEIGKITIASASLEEVAVRWAMMLSEDDVQETHARRLLAGLDRNLDFLSDLVKERVSPENQKEVLDLIERGRTLKNSRNENAHAVWGEMVDVQTREFRGVARSRFARGTKKGELTWDLRTPTIAELKQLAADLQKNARDLNDRLGYCWDYDDEVQRWRAEHNF